MGYAVDIQRLALSAIIDLQGSAQAISAWIGEGLPPMPQQANTASVHNGLALYWIGRERWLLRAVIEREEELFAMTKPDQAPIEISIVPVSDSLQFFSLTGAEAGEIVSIACPLDHHPSVFPDNGASYTDIFGIKGLLIRCTGGFEIVVERSFGDMIEDYLTRANA